MWEEVGIRMRLIKYGCVFLSIVELAGASFVAFSSGVHDKGRDVCDEGVSFRRLSRVDLHLQPAV